MLRGALVIALVAALVAPAAADVDYFHTSSDPRVVKMTRRRPRPLGDRLLIGGLAAAAAVAVGVGVKFNLDSRADARAVSTTHLTNQVWTAEDQATYDRARTDGIKAGVFYGVGALLAAGALVALWRTEQPEEEVHIGPATPTVAPTPGGAVLGAAWTF